MSRSRGSRRAGGRHAPRAARPRRVRGGALRVLLAGALLAGAASPVRAVVNTITYQTELNMNNGIDVPAGQRNLPGGVINVDCDAGPAEVDLFNQIGLTDLARGQVSTFGVACGVDTPTPDPATTVNLLFEGRTQIITQAEDGANVPVLGPTTFQQGTDAGQPIVFDADTGPPDHAELDTSAGAAFMSSNPNVVRDLPNATVIFNQSAVGSPFDLTIQGRVLNIPAMGAPLGEVGATVTVDMVRQNGGSIAPETTPRTTFTGPLLIPYAVDPMAAPDNPEFDGNTDAEGAFRIAYDFTNVQDGTYLLTFSTTDVQGNQNPMDGNNLVVTVIVDRTAPTLVFTNPPNPFITNLMQLEPFCDDAIFDLTGRVGEPLTLPATVTLDTFVDDSLFPNPMISVSTTTTTTPVAGAFSQPYDLTTAPVIPGPGEVDLYVTVGQAEDGAGNMSATATHTVIIDRAPTVTPMYSAPINPFVTNGAQIEFQGRVDNVRPGDEDLEEHGTVDFEITIFDTASPMSRTTFVAGGTPSAAVHSSGLDVIEAMVPPFPFGTADDFLGDIPDEFTFDLPVALAGFPDGTYSAELQTIDQACNRSGITTLTFCIGRVGPVVNLDLGQSGPDDQYSRPPGPVTRPPNQFGADDTVLIVSLRSPERPDPGNPVGPIPVPFPPPPNDFDPGQQDFLFLTGTVTDPCTNVLEVRAEGPNIPTTVFTVNPPAMNPTFSLDAIDISKLPEQIPETISITALNALGQRGPTTNVLVIRDVIPARAPVITMPQPQPFFTNRDTLDVDGIAEPDNLVALLLPPTTGAPIPPIPRTTNGDAVNPPAIPNPRSLFNSIPAFAVTTRARPDGSFSFRNVSLANVETDLITPATLLVQAIDTFDNTDPVLSVTPLEVLRTTGVGNVVAVTVDPGTLREIDVFPAPPTIPPTSGQFRGLETVDVRVVYDTLITEPPVLTVTQNAGAPPTRASLLAPADLSTLSTSTLVYRYPVIDRVNDFDGPVTLDLSEGLDVFGNVPNPLNIVNAFFVDSVAPVLNTSAAMPTFPEEAQRIMDMTPVLQADLLDVPATVATTASGVSTALSAIRLFGPLDTNPDQEIALTAVAPTPGFELAFTPAAPLAQDGPYRMVIEARDAVGNLRVIVRTFVVDNVAIPRVSIDHDPDCGSFVSVLPEVAGMPAITARIQDPTIDLAASMIAVRNSNGDTIPTSTARIAPDLLAAIPDPPLALDGSSDGQLTVLIDLVDSAGNATPQVTCPFVFDTTAPSVAFSFPATGACVNDPFRLTQVALADPPSPLSTSIFSAGMDLVDTTFAIRLAEPAFPSTVVTGSFVETQVSYRSTPGETAEVALLEFADDLGRVRTLAADGREDGVYELIVGLEDLAGNRRTHTSTFTYDTQEPHVVLDDFPDPSTFAGASFRISGEAFDLGPCGFEDAPVTILSTPTADSVQVRVVRRDPLGRPVLPPQAPFFDFQDATEVSEITTGLQTGISDRLRFAFQGTIPMAPDTDALLQVRVRDGAGNFRVVDRRIDIRTGPLPPPVLLRPPTGTFTNDKVPTFRWEPLLTARRYELEVTRVTPTPFTTSTTFVLDFPDDELDVDLSLVASQVPGGSPIATASTFSWRLRGVDVAGNPGMFQTTPFTFVLDPNLPRVMDVTVAGGSIMAGGTFTGGPNPVVVEFSDESGMDPSRPPEVILRPRDPDHPPIPVPVTFMGNLMAQGSVSLPVPGVDVDPNGTGSLVIRGAFDLAGNPLTEITFPVEVDVGPFIDLRLAPNPVAPLELLFSFRTRAFEGGPPEGIPFAASPPNPRVLVRQQGQDAFRPVSVAAVEATTPASSAFYGSTRVSPNLIGFVDFRVEATDSDGRTATRELAVAAATEALLGEGIVFPSVVRFSAVRMAAGALREGSTLLAMESRVAPGEPPAPGEELVPLQDLGAFLSGQDDLDRPLTVVGELDPRLREVFPPEKLGIYRAAPGAAAWTWVPTRVQDAVAEGRTRRLGRFAIMADATAPRVESVDVPGAVGVEDLGAGVDPASVVFVSPSGQEVPGSYDPRAGLAFPHGGDFGGSGVRRVGVAVRDRAGNRTVTTVAMTMSGPLAIEEAIAVPNPVRGTRARIRYRLSRAAEGAELRVFDTAGRRVARVLGPATPGLNDVEWDLRASTGRPVANGVYLYRLRVQGAGERATATGKLAVLR